MDVLEREEDVVRGRACGVVRVVAHRLDHQVEQGDEGVCERGLELFCGEGGQVGRQSADVVRVGERCDAERAACGCDEEAVW